MNNRKPLEFVVDTRPRGLRFEPRVNRLTHDGHRMLWEARFFERANLDKTYYLCCFVDGHTTWMREESWIGLRDCRQRKPFDVPGDLVLTEIPPLDQLRCATRFIQGNLTPEQKKILIALTGSSY
jgi:hypothetical protein